MTYKDKRLTGSLAKEKSDTAGISFENKMDTD